MKNMGAQKTRRRDLEIEMYWKREKYALASVNDKYF
jgi:hypothetical protein